VRVFLEAGIDVTCVDIDRNKIDNLNKGIIPIYEPGLEEMITREKGRLSFTTDIAAALVDSEVLFISVEHHLRMVVLILRFIC
jgi:UDPglucose 6-dehydrogenase